MAKVTVITGFYNRGELLRRTVESILNQTYADFELVVFDDASRDDTAARLAELAAEYNDPRFRYTVNEINRGFVGSLIETIGHTTSEYVAIQGSGDASLPRRLGQQVALLDGDSSIGAVGGWYYNVLPDDQGRRLRTPDASSTTFSSLLTGNVFSHGEVMFRRETYERAGGYRQQFKFAQDYDLWLRMSKISRFASVLEPIYERYVQFDGVSYHPEKVIVQSRYSIAARKLAQLSPDEEAKALAAVTAGGPEAIVPLSDPGVQKKVRSAVLRSALFGASDNARQVARTSVTNPFSRSLLTTAAALAGTPALGPLVGVARRALKIDRTGT
ncbi:glycosyltransferase [Microbacterium sp. CIAB417]|uniref:glycosyltransferase n=1 Tax=Microbacterium sp. CIAB417 TaxID=2860287 RepID=UPI001FAD1FE3|nr:glycosyltransferase [Microbacterium sp. CIAB417]